MANRMQRRAAAAAQRQSLVREFRRDGQLAGMIRNGISSEDLERKFEEGRRFGFKEASMPMFKTCLAASCLALHELFQFDEEQIFQAVSEIGNRIVYCLDNQELVDETLEKTGIQIDMDDAVHPVQTK